MIIESKPSYLCPTGYKQTEVGVIPEDWEVQSLGCVARVIGGGAFKSQDSMQTGVRWLKIANVALIESLEQLIIKKRHLKQATMQELLTGKKRLPGFSGEREAKRLGDVAEIVGGGTPSSFNSNYWNGTINWFTPTEIGSSKYTFESVRKITKEGFINCSGKILPIGRILLTTKDGIGDLSILMNESCTNQGFQSLIVKEDYFNEYLYYLMQTLKNVLIQNASGSTFLEINPNKIRQIKVSIPNFQEQTAIATIISDMDTEIAALETQLAKTRSLKQGIMHNLLTGRIRLI